MKIKDEKKILQAFCCNNDELRPVLDSPFLNEDRGEVWASDGHIMLMVDPKLLRRKYAKSDYGSKLEIPAPNSDTVVALKDIEEAFGQFELIPEMEDEEGDECECDACEGDGYVDWEFTAPDGHTYYMEYDCPVCDGTGEAREHHKVPTGRMLPPDNAMLVIDGVRFSTYSMMKAVEGLRLLGCEKMRHTVTAKGSANMFYVQDGIRLLVMPIIGEGTLKEVRTAKEES